MNLLSFDDRGNVVPYGLISINNLDFFEEFFVREFPDSQTRKKIYHGFLAYVHDLGELWQQNWTIWIDGSFTTLKTNPNDIDVVSFVNWSENLQEKAAQTFNQFAEVPARKRYHVDAHFCAIYPENDPRYAVNEENIRYWSDIFGFAYTNDLAHYDQPKGIIQIDIVGFS